MKKVITLFLFVSILFSLIGCDPASFHYTYEDLESNVESIELINYNNSDAIELFEKRNEVKDFDFSKLEIISVLSKEKTNDFLLEFSKIEFMLVWRHLDSPKGKSIKINYIDGSFDIICYESQFSCMYDKTGKALYFIGSGGGNQLKDLVQQMFN